MRKIAVIAGAGPAGLTAAFELLERSDVVPIVIEASGVIGGLAQTHVYHGNRMDLGGHRFFSKNRRVMDWWFSRLQHGPVSDPSAQFLLRPRQSRIFYHKRFFPYPLAITFTVAWRLGLWNTLLITLSYIKAQLFPKRDETFLDAFFINRFGRRLYETFFKSYTEKVWGVACDQIRADWGAQRIKGLSFKRAVSHAVRDLLSSNFVKEQHRRETSLITRFYYPRRGPGQMWETVADEVVRAGGEILFNTRVVGVRLVDRRVECAIIEHENGSREEVACDYFFSSIPLRELLKGMHPPPPADVTQVSDGLRYRDFMTVGLLFKQLHVSNGSGRASRRVEDNWIYVQDEGVQLGRIQIFNNWSEDLVASPANTVWLGLEYFVNENDELWKSADEDVIAFAVSELERIGFARREDMLDGCVVRVNKAYPAYVGSYHALDVVRRYVTSIPNLFCIGRNGMHRYNNQDHSMLTAMLAVDHLNAGTPSSDEIWDVNLEMVYHEES